MAEQALVELARSVLEPVKRVKMAFLFGSRAGARARPDSDMDIAIYWDPRPSRRQKEQVWESFEFPFSSMVRAFWLSLWRS